MPSVRPLSLGIISPLFWRVILVGATVMATVLALTLFTVGAQPAAQTTTKVVISPQQSLVAIGGSTAVDIRIENVTNLYGAEVHLTFDPALVEVVDCLAQPGVQICPGNFPDPVNGFVAQNTVNNVTGIISYAVTLLSPAPPVSGSGILARVTFRGLAEGTSAIHFTGVILSDPQAQLIPATPQDGSIIVANAGQVQGKVLLQGRQNHRGARVEIAGLFTRTITDGTYLFSLVPAGTYTVTASMSGYLWAKKANVGVVAGQTKVITDVTLLGGDLNGDGVVNIFDLVLSGANFGKQAPGPWGP